MATAARLYSILMLLIVLGSFIAGISDAARLGAAGVLGAFMVPLVIAIPTVSALAAIRHDRPRTGTFSLVVNKIYLFIMAAIFVGFALQLRAWPGVAFYAYLLLGGIVALCFVLNIIALERQRKLRMSQAV